MLRLNVSVGQKRTDGNYGSNSAGCGFDIELDSALLADPDSLRRQIHDAYQVATLAVEEQLRSIGQAEPPPPPATVAQAEAEPPSPAKPAPTRPAPVPAARAPQTGGQLYRWASDRQLLPRVVAFGKDYAYPHRVTDWDEKMVAHCYATFQELRTGKAPAARPAAAVNGPPR
jgi:hypothetical protein